MSATLPSTKWCKFDTMHATLYYWKVVSLNLRVASPGHINQRRTFVHGRKISLCTEVIGHQRDFDEKTYPDSMTRSIETRPAKRATYGRSPVSFVYQRRGSSAPALGPCSSATNEYLDKEAPAQSCLAFGRESFRNASLPTTLSDVDMKRPVCRHMNEWINYVSSKHPHQLNNAV
jgi:hypothetical protein